MTADTVYINELSLDGQFATLLDFDSQAIPCLIGIYEDLQYFHLTTYRTSTLYNRSVTRRHTLHDALFGPESRILDGIRKYKNQLARLTLEQPFWDQNPQQNKEANYSYCNQTVNDTSLAEARATDGIVISLPHKHFGSEKLYILENQKPLDIYNVTRKRQLVEILYARNKISFNTYCQQLFINDRLDFSKLHEGAGLELIPQQLEHQIIGTFKRFCQLKWTDLPHDSGLRYKPYHKSGLNKDFFTPEEWKAGIMEFRFSGGGRCFGIKQADRFLVLRIDLTHILGDR